jgi:hypothetical protein
MRPQETEAVNLEVLSGKALRGPLRPIFDRRLQRHLLQPLGSLPLAQWTA